MNYRTYQIMIRTARLGGKFLDVVAISYEAALADVVAAYGEVDVITWCAK